MGKGCVSTLGAEWAFLVEASVASSLRFDPAIRGDLVPIFRRENVLEECGNRRHV